MSFKRHTPTTEEITLCTRPSQFDYAGGCTPPFLPLDQDDHAGRCYWLPRILSWCRLRRRRMHSVVLVTHGRNDHADALGRLVHCVKRQLNQRVHTAVSNTLSRDDFAGVASDSLDHSWPRRLRRRVGCRTISYLHVTPLDHYPSPGS